MSTQAEREQVIINIRPEDDKTISLLFGIPLPEFDHDQLVIIADYLGREIGRMREEKYAAMARAIGI